MKHSTKLLASVLVLLATAGMLGFGTSSFNSPAVFAGFGAASFGIFF